MRGLIVASIILALALSGCASAAQKAVEQTSGVSVDQKGDSVTVKGKDGEQVTFRSNTPDEIKNFPIPSGFNLDSSASMTSSGDKVVVGTFKGKSSIDTVAAFYKKVSEDRQWDIGLTMSDSTFGQHHATAPDGKSYVVNYAAQDGGNIEINVMVGTAKTTPVPTQAKAAAATSAPATAATKAPATAAATAAATTPPAPPLPTTTQAKPQATATPEPTPVPEGPETVSIAKLPAELKVIPVPNGFALEKDMYMRQASGGSVLAQATLYGAGDVESTQIFYEETMEAKGWEQQTLENIGDDVNMQYFQVKDGVEMYLYISISSFEPGVEISFRYEGNKTAQ